MKLRPPLWQHLRRINLKALLVSLGLVSLIVIVVSLLVNLHALRTASQVKARVLAANATAALSFQDSNSLNDTLQSLQHSPDVRAAAIYDATGQRLAVFTIHDDALPERINASVGIAPPLNFRYLETRQTVVLDGEFLGTLLIHVGLEDLYLTLLWQVLTMVLAGIVAMTVSRIILERLNHAVLAPMQALTDVMEHVTAHDDYTVRAGTTDIAELAQLAAGFNVMLAQIENRDQRLQDYRDHLEDMVAQRTAALQASRDTAEQARQDAERANAAKSEFLSRMSHELRTPLNAILGFAQMLVLPGKSSLSEQQADNVQEILKAGQHLLVQVNEVLDLARIESGRIELSLEPLPLEPLIKDSIAQVQPLAAARGITIAAPLDEAVALQGDTTRVKQVLLNLLSNAIKYNRDGGQIHVAAVATGEQMRVEVRDTGRGIAPEKRERLFKPFERLESSYDGIEGTGIGLALVKRLVEAMGGEIGVESEEGIGSSFWFALPAATLPSLPAVKVGAGETAPAVPGSAQAPRRVLYIEDNPANLKLIRKIIGLRPEFVMLDAMNAELGLEIARRERPDLILLDINLPGMDGFAAIAQLQAWPETARIPVIAITANAMQRDIECGKVAGFADYLTKPIDIARLNQILDELSAGARS